MNGFTFVGALLEIEDMATFFFDANGVVLVSLLLTLCFTPCSNVCIVNFEHVNAG